MKTLKELQQERGDLFNAMEHLSKNAIADDGAWKDAEAAEQWDSLNATYNAVIESIDEQNAHIKAADANRLAVTERLDNARRLETEVVKIPGRMIGNDGAAMPVRQPIDFNDGLKAWSNSGRRDISTEERNTAIQCGLQIGGKECEFDTPTNLRMRELQSLARNRFTGPQNTVFTTGTTATGGATIPAETFVEAIEMAMLYYGPMRQVASIITTNSGENLTFPMVNDTANTGAIVAESTDVSNSGAGGSTGTWAQFTLASWKFHSNMLVVPHELLEDARGDLVGTLSQMIGIRLGRITNNKYTVGVGTTEPTGVAVAAPTGTTVAAAGDITWEETIDLQHSVDIAYRSGGNAGFMMHDLICSHLRKLSDSEGRPIYSMGINAGQPDRLNGYPIYVNNDMVSSMATTVTSMLYGDYSYYKIRRVNGTRLRRLYERYADLDQEAFIAFIREDGGLMNPGIPAVKKLIHP